MKHLLLTVLCLLTSSPAFAQDTIVTMTTTKDAVSINVGWTGTGSIIANGVELKNDIDIENIYLLSKIAIAANADGSVILTATGDVQLKHLYCFNYNFLSALDVTNCPKLTTLRCDNNSLTTLDISKCLELVALTCDNNFLTTLDISKCLELWNLSCNNNSLTTLDISKCLKLRTLFCDNNSLTTLDISKCPKLTHLNCRYNSLSALDVTNCPELTSLDCNNNSLSALDITKCPKLRYLDAETQTLALPVVSIDNNKLSIKNPITGSKVGIKNISHGGVRTGASIAWVIEHERGRVTFDFTTELPKEISGNPLSGAVTQPWIKTKLSGKMPPIVTMTTMNDSVKIDINWRGAGGISANGVELNNGFSTVIATTDGSVVLITTGDILLSELSCSNNSLTALDVTNCPELQWLYCGNNSLSELDITNCPELMSLSCSYNSLTSLNITKCPHLWHLDCSNNSLSALDLTGRISPLISLNANDQTLTLPVVAVPNGVKLSIKNPITCAGAKVSIENISHSGTYTNGAITWEVSGESGEVTFDFVTELPEEAFRPISSAHGQTRPPRIPLSGTVTQPWTAK